MKRVWLMALLATFLAYVAVFTVAMVSQLADAADRVHAGAGQWTFWSLLALLAVAVVVPTALLLRLPAALQPPASDDTAAQAAYLTPVVKCRPALPAAPQPHDLAACEPYLKREVALVQPKVILALGRIAAQTLLRESDPLASSMPLGKLRGQIYQYQGIPVVVSYPPSYLLRNPQEKARAWADLCLALSVARPVQA